MAEMAKLHKLRMEAAAKQTEEAASKQESSDEQSIEAASETSE